MQRRRELVDFEHHRAERIVVRRAASARLARADREVALAERGEEVRQRLQREHHAMSHAERASHPDADDDDGQRPFDFGRVAAGPEQDERDERGGEPRDQRQQQNALIEAKT